MVLDWVVCWFSVILFSRQGKKKVALIETMPSPQARRVAPVISNDMKKKILTSIKNAKERVKKGVKKEIITEDVRAIKGTYCVMFDFFLFLARR